MDKQTQLRKLLERLTVLNARAACAGRPCPVAAMVAERIARALGEV